METLQHETPSLRSELLLDDLIIKMYNGKVGINVEAANTELRLVQASAWLGG